jgi:hypothetical protein
MSISVVILAIVLGGIMTIVTLVFAIVSLAQGKSQNAIIWSVGFIIAVCILVLSAVQVVKRGINKIKNEVAWEKEHKGLTYNGDSDNVEYYKQEREYFLDTLKKYTNESFKDKVPADFYENVKAVKTEDSKIVVPFVYPISIKYNSYNSLGDFINDANDSVYLKNISKMAFDENFAIVKTDNKNDTEALKAGRGEVEYILFDLRTREYLPFTNEQMLLGKAGKIGYSGSTTMEYLSDDYKGWIDSADSFDY